MGQSGVGVPPTVGGHRQIGRDRQTRIAIGEHSVYRQEAFKIQESLLDYKLILW